MPAKRGKGQGLSTNKAAVAARRRKFVNGITSGLNGTQAAIAAGFAPDNAAVTASQLLSDPKIGAALQAARAAFAEEDDASTARLLKEIRALAFFDPRNLFRDDGTLKEPHEWDDKTAAAVAAIDTDELFEGRGADREKVGYTKKLRMWDKNGALDKLVRIAGLYEKDNRQKRADLSIEVAVVAPGTALPKPVGASSIAAGVRITSKDRG